MWVDREAENERAQTGKVLRASALISLGGFGFLNSVSVRPFDPAWSLVTGALLVVGLVLLVKAHD